MSFRRYLSAFLLSLTLVLGLTGQAFALAEEARRFAEQQQQQAEAQRRRNLSPSGFEDAFRAASAVAGAAVYRLNNFGDTGNEPGEPSLGGLMKKTAWGGVTLPQSSRVVIHTFGSDFDTVLAAYTGNAVNALTLVTSNDDRAVAGFGNNTQSLIQFNAVANTKYNIQYGSKTNVNGNIYAGVFVFPPSGGLSAFMAKVGSTVWNSRDFVCNDAHTITCGNPLFILHNSTNKTLTVTASSNLGAGVTAPVAFTLGPNQIRTAQFTFTGAFNTTTTRTVSGLFTFIGRENGTEITRAQHRALIVVGNATLGSVLGASVSPAVRAGLINETKPFDAKLTNTSSQTAIGCHARHDGAVGRLKVTFVRTDPNTGDFVGAQNQPFNIVAGQSVTFRVFVSSQETQLADPEFPTKVTLDCANTNPAPINLFNTFDLTAFGLWRPAQVDATKLSPLSDTLLVPATGSAQVRFSVVNRSATTELRALALYIRPIGDWGNPNKQYQLTICRLSSSNGSCEDPPSPNSIEYNAATNAASYFKIFVTAPPTDPGYSPGLRRVFLKVRQDSLHPLGFDAVVAAESVAVKKN